LTGVVCLVGTSLARIIYREQANLDGTAYYTALAVGNLLTLCVSLVTMIFNALIEALTKYFVMREGQDTKSQEEASKFAKLSLGLAVNTVLVPLAVGVILSNYSINQTWYEPGGVVSSMMILIICTYSNDVSSRGREPAAIAPPVKHERSSLERRQLLIMINLPGKRPPRAQTIMIAHIAGHSPLCEMGAPHLRKRRA
jgi:hypothetical protein